MGKKGKPTMIDLSLLIQAGIDPKTLAPARLSCDGDKIRDVFKMAFRVVDEQDAVNRYRWFNLPMNLSSQELERLIYYKGQLCFFYYKDLDKFFILPYALDGTIDFYGRFNTVHPIPFAVGTTEEEEKWINKQIELLSTLKLKVIKEPMFEEEITEEVLDNSCVLLHDYTKQLAQNIIPRQQLNDAFVDMEAEILPYMGTALLAGTGIKGMRVVDADAAEETERASSQIRTSALMKKLFVAMTSKVDFQELSDGSPMKTEEYLLALQGVENLRKGTLGIENGGIFQKKAHKLESEQTGNESSVATVFQDGLSIRQYFCNVVNSIWGLDIWCEPSEAVIGQDLNLDGVMYDEQASEAPQTAPQQQEGSAEK